MGDRKRAIDIYSQLLRYVEKNDQQLVGYGGHYCLIAHNYAIDLLREERYREAIGIAERGRKTGLYYGNLQFLPGFAATQGLSWHFLGNDEKSKQLYRQTYYTYELFEDEVNKETAKIEMEEYLGIKMPE